MVDLYQNLERVGNVPVEDVMTDVRVLFADDSQDTLDLLATMTEGLGWTGSKFVVTATQMIDAVNQSEYVYDAIVADINYFNAEAGHRITGITAAREIRKVMPNVPIVFISAYVTSIIREEVRRVCAEIVEKPFDIEKLFIRISQLVYWYRLSRRQDYDGPERRRSSVNHTNERRRMTDQPIAVPERIKDTIIELRSTRKLNDERGRSKNSVGG